MSEKYEKKLLLFMAGHIFEDVTRVLKEDPRYNHQYLVKEILSDKEDLEKFQNTIAIDYIDGDIDPRQSYWVNIDRFIDKELSEIKKGRIANIEKVYSGTEYIAIIPDSHKYLLKGAITAALEESGEYEGMPIALEDAVNEVMEGRLCDLEDMINWKETLAGGDWRKDAPYFMDKSY